MSQTNSNPWLHRFAVLTALATLGLLGVGGLVTSHGVGMAVPDWPTTYGYNMFFFPISKWTGGIFYEHSHRLVASGVGLLTTILAVWLGCKESRVWLRWLGVLAFFAVVLQGVLGGLRVVLFKDEIGIFHATLAQLFFALVCAIALFTSRWWVNLSSPMDPPLAPPQRGTAEWTPVGSSPPGRGQGWVRSAEEEHSDTRHLGRWFLFATVLVFLQLILGATMRHQHAGLAIPDFPLAYGKVWPATDADSIAGYNARRIETTAANPITAFQVGLQMAHRLMALAILVCVGAVAWGARGAARAGSETGAPVASAGLLLARADSRPDRARRVDDLVEQGRGRNHGACIGGRTFARDRRAGVYYCFPPFKRKRGSNRIGGVAFWRGALRFIPRRSGNRPEPLI